MQQYIYGASVQGIQSFIFQTNKLKEIVGASQLVDEIFGDEFEKFCKEKDINHSGLDIIMSAAGNIRLITDETSCQNIVKFFPKHISNYAPGITVSQAAVKMNGDFNGAREALEKRLSVQKNIVAMPVDIGFMGLERARRTGGVAYDFDKDGIHRDAGTSKKYYTANEDKTGLFRKFKSGFIKTSHIPFDVEHITKQHDNAWLAIIHADGNNLGKFVRDFLKGITDSKEVKTKLSEFSKNLEMATQKAAQAAFEKVVTKKMQDEIETKNGHYPLRPVILGGDDLTIIIRADLAFKFTKAYLEAFEKETESKIGKKTRRLCRHCLYQTNLSFSLRGSFGRKPDRRNEKPFEKNKQWQSPFCPEFL